jgi:Mg2+ and Co2+ transporter CorA
MMPSPPINGPSWSGTAQSCLPCFVPARYDDRREQVEFGELHVVTGEGFVVTIQHAESPDLASVRCRLEAFRALLQNALTVNATLVGQRQNDEIKRLTQTSLDQNEDVKRISAWAAILFAPTLVGTIYGMNFSGTASSAASAWLSIVSALHHQQLTVASCRSKRWPPVWSRSPATIRATAPSGRGLVRFPS